MGFYSPPKQGSIPSASNPDSPADHQASLKKLQEEYLSALEKVSGLSKEEARKQLLEEAEKYYADELAKIIEQARQDYLARADELAQDIIVSAMLHGATDFPAEYTV